MTLRVWGPKQGLGGFSGPLRREPPTHLRNKYSGLHRKLHSEPPGMCASQGRGSGCLPGWTREARGPNHGTEPISIHQCGLRKSCGHSFLGSQSQQAAPTAGPLPTWCRRFSRKLRRARITSTFTPRTSRDPSCGSRVRRTSRHWRGKFPKRFTVWLGTDGGRGPAKSSPLAQAQPFVYPAGLHTTGT